MATFDYMQIQLRPGLTRTLEELLEGWERHVLRLSSEMSERMTETTWGAHDYFAALHLRDVIEDGRFQLDHHADEELSLRLGLSEETFLAFTEVDHNDSVVRFGEQSVAPHDRWWWRRIPRAGLVRSELDAWYATANGLG